MSLETDLLQRILDALQVAPSYTVPDVPINIHQAINTLYADSRYSQSYLTYPTPITVATGDFDFNTLTNPALYNDFTFTASGATATINHFLNVPHTCRIRIATGKTITIANRVDSATGFVAVRGAANFVGVGTNFDYIIIENGVGAYILGSGANF